MNFLKNTYLFRLYQFDKKLFGALVLYCLGFLYCARVQREEFPFLLYAMYSLKEYPQQQYTAYTIFIDGKEVDFAKLKDSQRELILTPLEHTIALVKSEKITEQDFEKFKKWLFTYSVDMRGLETNRMDVYELTCTYSKSGKPEVVNKALLYSYVAE